MSNSDKLDVEIIVGTSGSTSLPSWEESRAEHARKHTKWRRKYRFKLLKRKRRKTRGWGSGR